MPAVYLLPLPPSSCSSCGPLTSWRDLSTNCPPPSALECHLYSSYMLMLLFAGAGWRVLSMWSLWCTEGCCNASPAWQDLGNGSPHSMPACQLLSVMGREDGEEIFSFFWKILRFRLSLAAKRTLSFWWEICICTLPPLLQSLFGEEWINCGPFLQLHKNWFSDPGWVWHKDMQEWTHQ